MEDIEHYDIPIYNFPYDVEEDDEETIQDNSELRVCLEGLFGIIRVLTCLVGPFTICHHWFGGSD